MSRGERTRVAKQIYADAYGFAAIAKVRQFSKEQRFPPDTTIEAMQAWQQQARGELLIEHPKGDTSKPRMRDAFSRAVTRYLTLIAKRPGAAADAAHLAAWVEQFGDRERGKITSTDVRLAFATWRESGQRRTHQKHARPVAPQTLRHRYRVLKKLYRVLDGPKAPTPCDDVPRPKVPKSQPKDVPIAVIKRVATKVEKADPLTYARFMVLATTGKAPAEVMKLDVATDVDFRRRIWRIKPAKDREPQLLELNAEMIAALQFFRDAGAEGNYSTTQYARVLRRCGWPAHIRPYNVRHALAIELLRLGADLGDIQQHLGHASIETTRRFYAGFLKSRARETSTRLNGRLGLKSATRRSATHKD